MSIINTSKGKTPLGSGYFAVFLLIVGLLYGCSRGNSADSAQKLSAASQKFYHDAVKQYQDLISRGKDLPRLNYELGRLYFDHGEYELAAKIFKDSELAQAKKYLAISLYKSGDLTAALNAFKQIKTPDDEVYFFYGLTAEKLNLFDEALKQYRFVTAQPFKPLSLKRVETITQENLKLTLADLPQAVQAVVRNAPAAENYPNAGALILYVDEAFKVAPDNTAALFEHYMIKILNERGKEDFSEMVIDYDSTDEKIELEYARTIKPDGTVIPVGTRHIRDVSKYMNFPLYSNARAMIISFPEVSQGAVLEYKLKIIRNELINKKDFVMPYTVQESEPVIYARFLITVPENTKTHIEYLNAKYNYYGARLEPKITQKQDSREYLWEFTDIPQIIPEPNMPPAAEISPIIVVSTFDTWQELYDWWWGLAKDKIKADGAIKAKAAELAGAQKTLKEKAQAIYNFCAQNIRYVAVEYGQAGYEPHNAADIFSNKYGDCKDQAILLVTMLKEIGIPAHPVLIPTKGAINLREDFPSSYFNHCIAAVELDGKNIFMDPTASTCSFADLPADDQQRKVLIFNDNGYKIEETPMYPAGHNKLIQTLRIRISADETLSAEREVFSFGQYDQMQRSWLTYTAPEQISQGLEEKIQGFASGARLIKYGADNVPDLNRPVELRYSFSGQEYWTKAGALRILPQLSEIDTSICGLKERRYPIDLGLPETRTIEYEIKLPPGYKVKYLPQDISKTSPWLKMDVLYSQKDGSIILKQETTAGKLSVLAQEYPGFKAFIEELARQTKQRVILEKIR